MSPDQVSAIASVAQAVLALVALVATVGVTVAAYLGGRAISRIEHDRGIREAWNAINQVILSNDEMVHIAEALLPQPGSGTRTAAEAKQKWLAFMILNVLSSTFNGAQKASAGKRAEVLKNCEYQLRHLLATDHVFVLTQEGYSDAFSALCRRVKTDISGS